MDTAASVVGESDDVVIHDGPLSIRDGVDGKASEGRTRLGTIGRDHLGKIGHHLGRNYQLRHNGMLGGVVPVAHTKKRRRQEPIRSMRASTSQNASGGA